MAPHFVFDSFRRILFRADVLHFSLYNNVLFVTQCSMQGHSQIYRVWDMLNNLYLRRLSYHVIFNFLLVSRLLRWEAHICVWSGFARKSLNVLKINGVYCIMVLKFYYRLGTNYYSIIWMNSFLKKSPDSTVCPNKGNSYLIFNL